MSNIKQVTQDDLLSYGFFFISDYSGLEEIDLFEALEQSGEKPVFGRLNTYRSFHEGYLSDEDIIDDGDNPYEYIVVHEQKGIVMTSPKSFIKLLG